MEILVFVLTSLEVKLLVLYDELKGSIKFQDMAFNSQGRKEFFNLEQKFNLSFTLTKIQQSYEI